MSNVNPVALLSLLAACAAAAACTAPAPAPAEPPALPGSAAPAPALDGTAQGAAAVAPAAPTAGSGGVAPTAGDAPAPVAADAGSGATPPTGLRSLSGTRWVEAAPGAQFKEVAFTESFVFFRMQDDTSVTLSVDYSGAHPFCLGYPSCLLTVDGNQQAVPFWLGQQDDVIFFVECRAEGQIGPDGQPIALAALRTELGSAIVHDTPTTVCWNPGRPPFRQAPR